MHLFRSPRAFLSVSLSPSLCLSQCVCAHVCVCLYVCVCVCVCVCICEREIVYVCVSVYTYIYKPFSVCVKLLPVFLCIVLPLSFEAAVYLIRGYTPTASHKCTRMTGDTHTLISLSVNIPLGCVDAATTL
jgi:hypothetical protein